MRHANIDDVVRAAAKGESEAFGLLVEKYQSLVCAIAMGVTGDLERSEELAQGVFVKSWQGLGGLKDPAKFKSWICSIARNEANNCIRNDRRAGARRAAQMDIEDITCDENGPTDNAISSEERTLVREAMEKLDEHYREVMVLYYREGQSVKEVASQLELGEEAVRTRLARGRAMIKDALSRRVEGVLEKSRPGKAFTTAVLGAIAGVSVGGAAASAAGAKVGAGTAGAVFSGVMIKLMVAAAVVVIGGGAIIAHKMHSGSSQDKTATVGRGAAGSGDAVIDSRIVQTKPTSGAELARASADLTGAEAAVLAAVNDGNASGEYVFKPRGVLSGLIKDKKTGEPVTDAQLELVGMGSGSMGFGRTKTDANGFYFFEWHPGASTEGNCKLMVTSNEYIGMSRYDDALIINVLKDVQAVRHFELEQACMAELEVVDEGGGPVKDAQVMVSSMGDMYGRNINDFHRQARTDANGFILIGGLKASDSEYMFTVTASETDKSRKRNGYNLSKYSYAPNYTRVLLSDPNIVQAATVVLEKGISVKGKALYADGTAASDVTIEAKPGWWHCSYGVNDSVIEPNGYFTLEHVTAGNYELQAQIPQGEDSWTSSKIAEVRFPLEAGKELVVTVPGKSSAQLCSISGEICWEGKKPSSVNVQVMSNGAMQSGCYYNIAVYRLPESAKSAPFKIDRLEKGSCQLRFEGSGMEEVLVSAQAPSEGLKVKVKTFDNPQLTAKVVDAATGKAVSRFTARIVKIRTLRGPNYTVDGRWVDYESAQGKCQFSLNGPGVYRVDVAVAGGAGSSAEINTDEQKEAIIEIAAGGTIKGTVVDESGKVVSGAKVYSNWKSGKLYWQGYETEPAAAAVTGEQGFVLENMPAGLETIRVMHPDYEDEKMEGIDCKAAMVTDVKVVLKKGGAIEGYTYDKDGKLIGGIGLIVSVEPGSLGQDVRRTMSDVNGYYRIGGLPEKRCEIETTQYSEKMCVISRSVSGINGETVRVDFGGVGPVVRGQVVLEDKPVVNADLGINELSSAAGARAKTDGEGRFEFRGLVPGKYRLSMMRKSGGAMSGLGEVEVGARDMDMGIVPNSKGLKVRVAAGTVVTSMMLQEKGTGLLGGNIKGQAINPAKDGEPFVFNNVAAGEYMLTIMTGKNMTYRQKVEVSGQEQEITAVVPNGTAEVWGNISENMAVIIIREDESLYANVLMPTGDYKVSGLPGGKYKAITVSQGGMFELENFEVGEGQSVRVDLDSAKAHGGKALIRVNAAYASGKGISDLKVTLEGNGEVIDATGTGETFMCMAEAGVYTVSVSQNGSVLARQQIAVKSPVINGQGEMQEFAVTVGK